MLTKKDFAAEAARIRQAHPADRLLQATMAARIFKHTNPRFNAKRFFQACGLDEIQSGQDERFPLSR